MPLGYANQCKVCVKERASLRYAIKKKDPSWVEQERLRGKEKYHRLQCWDKDKNRMKTDDLFKLKVRLRQMTNIAFKK